MELLESDDMKAELLRKAAKHRQDIEGDVKLISDNTKQILTNALIIGGSLALAYVIAKQFGGDDAPKKTKVKHKAIKVVSEDQPQIIQTVSEEPESPGIFSDLTATIANQATLFLLNLAKDKLLEFLQSQLEKKDE